MAFELWIVAEAERDIDEAVSWYEGQQAGFGIQFHFSGLVENLKKHPHHYSYFREDYRQLLIKPFPFKIVFKANSNAVLVLGVFHKGRDADELFKR